MRKYGYSFLLLIGLILTFGAASNETFAQNNGRAPRDTGILSVKTSPGAYPVKVNGQVIGMSGIGTASEFYLAPGLHRVEIEGPNGQTFSKEVEIRRNARNCICIKVIEEVTKRPCPYDIRLDGPERVVEGDLITFASFNRVTTGAIPVKYQWSVLPEMFKITSGLGTPSITVDTTGMGGQTIRAILDVNDGVYDEKCKQNIEVTTAVDKLKIPEPVRFDEFESRAFDDDKARLDTLVIALQNQPDSQAYIIMYQGTDRDSQRTRRVDLLSQRTMDYLVKTRGVDPRRVVITRASSTRPRTTYEIYIIPPGAQPPTPQ